jgi:hypothetical protein
MTGHDQTTESMTAEEPWDPWPRDVREAFNKIWPRDFCDHDYMSLIDDGGPESLPLLAEVVANLAAVFLTPSLAEPGEKNNEHKAWCLASAAMDMVLEKVRDELDDDEHDLPARLHEAFDEVVSEICTALRWRKERASS